MPPVAYWQKHQQEIELPAGTGWRCGSIRISLQIQFIMYTFMNCIKHNAIHKMDIWMDTCMHGHMNMHAWTYELYYTCMDIWIALHMHGHMNMDIWIALHMHGHMNMDIWIALHMHGHMNCIMYTFLYVMQFYDNTNDTTKLIWQTFALCQASTRHWTHLIGCQEGTWALKAPI